MPILLNIFFAILAFAVGYNYKSYKVEQMFKPTEDDLKETEEILKKLENGEN